MSNQRTRFILDQLPLRGVHVNLEQVWQHIVGQKNYPAPIARALGELVAAGALLAANLKFDGTFILQVQGTGVLKLLVAEATSEQTCRGTARFDDSIEIADDTSLQDLMGEQGQFVLTLQPRQGEMWQGIVGLQGTSIAQMLANYLAQSEQLASRFFLAATAEGIAGLFIQKMPSTDQRDPDGWARIEALATTVKPDELLKLSSEELLTRLFHEETVRVFAAQEVTHNCPMDWEKVRNMLRTIGREDIYGALKENGAIVIRDDLANHEYRFEKAAIDELFSNVPETPPSVH